MPTAYLKNISRAVFGIIVEDKAQHFPVYLPEIKGTKEYHYIPFRIFVSQRQPAPWFVPERVF